MWIGERKVGEEGISPKQLVTSEYGHIVDNNVESVLNCLRLVFVLRLCNRLVCSEETDTGSG